MDNAVTSTLQNIPKKVPWFCRTLRSTQGSSLRDKGGRCVRMTILPGSRADCLGILGAATSWNPMGMSRDSFTFLPTVRYDVEKPRHETSIQLAENDPF